jgi:secreted PhoX family phosphatase
VTAAADAAAGNCHNAINAFDRMVEIDPFDPASTPVKRTALGRFASEGVVFAPTEAGKPIVCHSDDDSIFACPDGMRMDANRRLWIQTDMGDVGGAFRGVLAPFGTNRMLCAGPATGEIRRFLTGPWGQEVTGVITTPDQRTMFVNIQHPGTHASAEQFAAGDMGAMFPDGPGSIPRSGARVITREDGGIIGA